MTTLVPGKALSFARNFAEWVALSNALLYQQIVVGFDGSDLDIYY
jgi:hypothetical protein